jgi:hypothetical protein
MREYLEQRAQSNDPLFFTILDAAGAPAGYASLMRIEPAHRVIEIGNILYLPRMQAHAPAQRRRCTSSRATSSKRWVTALRVEVRFAERAVTRRRAAAGFTFEGIFGQHMIVKGKNRDTAWYSMLDGEWPARKEAFESGSTPRTSPPMGRQRSPLSR